MKVDFMRLFKKKTENMTFFELYSCKNRLIDSLDKANSVVEELEKQLQEVKEEMKLIIRKKDNQKNKKYYFSKSNKRLLFRIFNTNEYKNFFEYINKN